MLLCSFMPSHGLPGPAGETLPLEPGVSGVFSWQSGMNNPQVRFESAGAAVNGKLYVFGGFFNSSAHTTLRSDVYDPVTNTWTPIADMLEHVTHASQAVDGGLKA